MRITHILVGSGLAFGGAYLLTVLLEQIAQGSFLYAAMFAMSGPVFVLMVYLGLHFVKFGLGH